MSDRALELTVRAMGLGDIAKHIAKLEAERDQLREAIERAVQFLPLTRVDSSPSEQTNNCARAGAMLRKALRSPPQATRRKP